MFMFLSSIICRGPLHFWVIFIWEAEVLLALSICFGSPERVLRSRGSKVIPEKLMFPHFARKLALPAGVHMALRWVFLRFLLQPGASLSHGKGRKKVASGSPPELEPVFARVSAVICSIVLVASKWNIMYMQRFGVYCEFILSQLL